MAISSLTLPIKGMVFRGLSKDPARPVFEYADGARTDKPKVDELNRPLFRHPILVQIGDENPEQTMALLPTDAPLGVLTEIALTSTSTVTVRSAPAGGFGLSVTVQGELAQPLNK